MNLLAIFVTYKRLGCADLACKIMSQAARELRSLQCVLMISLHPIMVH